MKSQKLPAVLITGASSGIGKSCAEVFARAGHSLFLGARREKELKTLAKKLQKKYGVFVFAHSLDVTKSSSIQGFFKAVQKKGTFQILVNNAGLALGVETVENVSLKDAQAMFETNVLGLIQVTQAALKVWKTQKNLEAHIINLGSIAGIYTYEGGGVYCGTKHAVRALSQTLRQELLGRDIRVSEIAPGMVETQFSAVRYKGNLKKAKRVYEGLTPLNAEDVAELVHFVANRPKHVNVDHLVVTPVRQAGTKILRS